MIAESREVKIVLRELLGSKGCDLLIYPMQRYIELDQVKDTLKKYSYWDLFTRVRMRNEILLGWIKDEQLVLNPKGTDREVQHTWAKTDNLVILSKRKMKKKKK